MNVLVTGAAGFIGSNLVELLLKERPEWNITALDLLTYAGNLENLASALEKDNCHFVKADIADEKAIGELFSSEKFDLVFHLAAESHVDRSLYAAGDFVRSNVMGTQVLVSAALANDTERFVHISTDEVYGTLGPTGVFREDTPLDPTSPYAASKASSDLMVLAACKTHKFNASITRCTNNYGHYQFPEKFIPLFITNALEDKPLPVYGDGMQVRSWIHVLDHARALLQVAEKGKLGEVYNIGSPDGELPNIVVAKKMLEILGKPESLLQRVEDRLAHDRRYAVTAEKIEKELGWSAQVPFEEGLKETIQWYLDNRGWWERIKSGAYQSYYEDHYSRVGLRQCS